MALAKIFSDDFHIQKLQDNVASALGRIDNSIILNGVIVTGIVTATSTDIQVDHGLNRNIVGFVLIDSNGQVDIWQSTTTNNFKTKFILLRASTAVTISLYIF